MTTGCVFCEIVAGQEPARILRTWPDALALLTIDPYTAGHALVIPRRHVPHAAADPAVTGAVMTRAAQLAADTMSAANILTSWGEQARQTVTHLHVHVVPRVAGDEERLGLWPWPRWAQLVAPAPGWAAPARVLAD
jgi:histidine triad (HIT) family protein